MLLLRLHACALVKLSERESSSSSRCCAAPLAAGWAGGAPTELLPCARSAPSCCSMALCSRLDASRVSAPSVTLA
jgi:hypothetical protein